MSRATGWRRQLADNPQLVGVLVGMLVYALWRLIAAAARQSGVVDDHLAGGPLFGVAAGISVYAYGRSIQNAERREEMSSESKYVEVNGARIERSSFEGNVEEARSVTWRPGSAAEIHDHTPCIVCVQAISARDDDPHFTSSNGRICAHCHSAYVEAG